MTQSDTAITFPAVTVQYAKSLWAHVTYFGTKIHNVLQVIR